MGLTVSPMAERTVPDMPFEATVVVNRYAASAISSAGSWHESQPLAVPVTESGVALILPWPPRAQVVAGVKPGYDPEAASIVSWQPESRHSAVPANPSPDRGPPPLPLGL